MELKHLRKAEQQQQQQVQQEQPLLPVEKQLLRQYATINESKIPVVSGGGGGAGSSATIPPTRGSAARTSHHHMTLRGRSRIRYQRPNAGETAPAAAQTQPCTVATARYYRDVSAIPTIGVFGGGPGGSSSTSASFNIATRSASATLDLNSNPLPKTTKLTSLNNNPTTTPPPSSNPADTSRLSGRGSAELQAIIEHGLVAGSAKRNKRSLSSTRLDKDKSDEYNTKLLRKTAAAAAAAATAASAVANSTSINATHATNASTTSSMNNNCKYNSCSSSNSGSFKLSRRLFGESGSSASTSASNSGIPTPTAPPSSSQWQQHLVRGVSRASSEKDRDRERQQQQQQQSLDHQQSNLKLRKKISY